MNVQDFPGPGIIKEKNLGLSGRRGNPGRNTGLDTLKFFQDKIILKFQDIFQHKKPRKQAEVLPPESYKNTAVTRNQ